MTCTRCGTRTNGHPIIVVLALYDDAHDYRDRFTGIVWCADCIPSGPEGDRMREQLRAAQSERTGPAEATEPIPDDEEPRRNIDSPVATILGVPITMDDLTRISKEGP